MTFSHGDVPDPGGYDGALASFTLDGETYEYLRPDPGHPAQDARSWEWGTYPKVMASVPLAGGRTVDAVAVAERWNPPHSRGNRAK